MAAAPPGIVSKIHAEKNIRMTPPSVCMLRLPSMLPLTKLDNIPAITIFIWFKPILIHLMRLGLGLFFLETRGLLLSRPEPIKFLCSAETIVTEEKAESICHR